MLRFMVSLELIGHVVKKADIITQTSRGVSIVIVNYESVHFVKKLSFTSVHIV